jgi:hypothetical protein
VRQGRVLREGGQALRDGRLVGRHPGAGGHGAGGVDDRPVAGAAAQVAAQRIGCLAARHGALAALALVLVQRVQAHHEARRAEAALRAVRIDQRLLHRVQRAAGAAQLIDRDELLAVERADEGDAAIDGAPAQAARAGLTHHHGAGAAVALGAALLGALEPALLAQPLQHRARGRHRVERDRLVVEPEADRSGRHGRHGLHGRLSGADGWLPVWPVRPAGRRAASGSWVQLPR